MADSRVQEDASLGILKLSAKMNRWEPSSSGLSPRNAYNAGNFCGQMHHIGRNLEKGFVGPVIRNKGLFDARCSNYMRGTFPITTYEVFIMQEKEVIWSPIENHGKYLPAAPIATGVAIGHRKRPVYIGKHETLGVGMVTDISQTGNSQWPVIQAVINKLHDPMFMISESN